MDGPVATGLLRVLLVEDSSDDASLIVRELKRGGYDVTYERVETPTDMLVALEQGGWDIVLSDFSMPQFDGVSALRLLRELKSDLPFILVSGTVGEEMAVTAMKAGADDYIMKDRLARLAPAVRRELEQARVRRERVRAEHAELEQRAFAEALRDTASALNSALKFEEMLDRILDYVGRVVPHDAVNVMLLEGTQARVIRAHGYSERGGDDLVGAAVPLASLTHGGDESEMMKPQLIRDTWNDPQWFHYAKTEWIRSFVSMPIVVDANPIGLINLDSSQPNFFTEAHGRRLRVFADQVAVAMQRARLFEQTERQLRQMNALRRIDNAITSSLDLNLTLDLLLDQVTTELGVDAADVLLFRPHLQVLEFGAGRGFRSNVLRKSRLYLGEGLAGRAAQERRVISVPNLMQDLHGYPRAQLLPNENFVAYYAAPLIAKGQVKGVLELFHRSPLTPDAEWFDFLNALSGQAAIAIDNFTLFEGLQRSNEELIGAYDATIEGWSYALDLRDKETEGHTQRVTVLTLNLARTMGIREDDLVQVRRGALLHDIGKMGIPDSILLKPGPLTEEEWVIMKKHPTYALEMISRIAYLRRALDIPYGHHEKWDGTGYPRGLKGKEIPLAARIFAIVDVYDALSSERPYRSAWERDTVLEYIHAQSGKHFDPVVAEVFMRMQGAL